jgi:hypothetical protein
MAADGAPVDETETAGLAPERAAVAV